MRKTFLFFFAAIALFPGTSWSQEFTVTDLGTLDSGTSVAAGVNNSGQVVGDIEIPGYDNSQYAFLYSKGVMTQLAGFPDSTFDWAYAINDDGSVVGSSIDENAVTNAVLWNGTLQDLSAGSPGSAYAINVNGVAAGWDGWKIQDVEENAVTFSGGQVTPVPTGPYVEFEATGINTFGQLSGQCINSQFGYQGCTINGGTIQILKEVSGYKATQPLAINSSGYMCGFSYNGPNYAPTATAATYWKSAAATKLGEVAHTSNGQCVGMDNWGQGVGIAGTETNSSIGVFWDPVNGARDLNTLIPQVYRKGHSVRVLGAVGLTDTGFIAANCLFGGSRQGACLLTVNPVLIYRNNVLTAAEQTVECAICKESLEPEARSLPKTLVGVSADKREHLVTVVDKMGSQIETLMRDGKLSAPVGMLLTHQGELLLTALEPNR